MKRLRRVLGAALAAALLAPAPSLGQVAPERAQGAPVLSVEREDGSITEVPLALERGFAAVDLSVLRDLGWSAEVSGEDVTVAVPGQIEIALHVGSPFFRWDGLVLQLADAPYRAAAGVLVPLQLVTDFFPRRLPDLYEFEGASLRLRAGEPGPRREARAPAPPPTNAPSPYTGPRVVVIDAGHGGADPGAIGPRGIREKDVALGIATQLAEILGREPQLEVHLTRDADTFVELWKRGEIATQLKGERPGLFVSIHANSFPNARTTRGFETYFLSEARTEHERRVAAIENAPLSFQTQDVDPALEPDLDFILRELANLDHPHWSALLAELTQEELDDVHPGPNRGVKQGMLAVLTNALMPSILVETGYLSNNDEGRLLGQPEFQRQAAEALARAIVRFFERYPPGNGLAGSGEAE